MEIEFECCRICLSFESHMMNLFKHPVKPFSMLYSEILNECANVKVRSGDKLPKKICFRCADTLKDAYKMKLLAERSNKFLKAKMGQDCNVKVKKLKFDSLMDIKEKIDSTIAGAPKLEMKVEVLDSDYGIPDLPIGDDMILCNTIIKKIEAPEYMSDMEVEYLDDYGGNSDNSDADYEPLSEYSKKKKTPVKPRVAKVNAPLKKSAGAQPGKKRTHSLKRNCSIRLAGSSYIKTYAPIKPIPVEDRTSSYIKLPSRLDAVANSERRRSLQHARYVRLKKLKMQPKAPKELRPKEKPLCPICGILTYAMGNHLLTHQEKKPYSCVECSKSFTQKTNYEMHMKRHSGIRDHVCDVCGAAFFFLKSVTRHKLIHKGERPFQCTLCPKRFIANCDLTRHLKVHAGYKPYKCVECSMSFNAKHQLDNHMRMHTGERPYTCQVCNVAFAYKVNLNNHVMKIHGLNFKFKSIHTVTPEVLAEQYELAASQRKDLQQLASAQAMMMISKE